MHVGGNDTDDDAASAAAWLSPLHRCESLPSLPPSPPPVVQTHGDTMTKAQGTQLYMAPEIFRGDTRYGTTVDVYSFGIVLWELATRQEPWSELPSDEAMFFEELNQALMTGRRPHIPDEVTEQFPRFVTLMQHCWSGDARDRPTFSHAASELEACIGALDSA
jgi:serine/threonine protein kinase